MIPKNINEVTNEWLGECVHTSVKSHQVIQIGEGVGIMGDIYRVVLEYAEGAAGPESVVVKLPSSFEENRAQGVALGMFEAEVRFYNELASKVTSGLPAIYRCEINVGTAEFVIVMEDLSDHVMVDQFVGMTFEQAQAAVKVIANVHAVWWNDVDSLDWIPTMIGERIAFVDQMMTQLVGPFEANFGDILPDGGAEVFRAFAGNYLSLTQAMAGRSPWTLVHQDFRVENVLFGADDADRVVIIDWQGIGRGPGAYDLAYILSGSMKIDQRRERERELVQLYHEELLKRGVVGYDFDALWADYGLAQFMGGLATTTLIGGGMDLNNERGKLLCTTMARRHATAALDHGGVDRILATVAG